MLVTALRAGDETARAALIDRYIGLAIKAAAGYDDEVLSLSLMMLVEAVDKFRDGNQPWQAITAYLQSACRRAVPEALRDRERRRVRHSKADVRTNDEVPPPNAFEDFIDEILACCETDRDREIVALRLNGLSQQEVAQKLGVSAMTISRELSRLELRLSTRRKLNA